MAAQQSAQHSPFSGKAYSANYFMLREKAECLPVSKQLPELLDTIAKVQVTVLVGETGSGKTTQVAKGMLTPGGPKIALTQPRRLAAQLVSVKHS